MIIFEIKTAQFFLQFWFFCSDNMDHNVECLKYFQVIIWTYHEKDISYSKLLKICVHENMYDEMFSGINNTESVI